MLMVIFSKSTVRFWKWWYLILHGTKSSNKCYLLKYEILCHVLKADFTNVWHKRFEHLNYGEHIELTKLNAVKESLSSQNDLKMCVAHAKKLNKLELHINKANSLLPFTILNCYIWTWWVQFRPLASVVRCIFMLLLMICLGTLW